jgi:hypothetical protein
MRTLIISSALCLAGCMSSEHMDAGLDRLVGQPIQVATDRLGPPSGQTEIAGGKSYFWVSNGADLRVSTAEPPSKFGWVSPTDMVDPPPTPSATYSQRCWVRVNAGADGKITDYQWSKNTGGCGAFAARLGGF